MNSAILKALMLSLLTIQQALSVKLPYISNNSYVGEYNQPDFIQGVLDTVKSYRKDLPELMWDQDSAACSYVIACIRGTYQVATAHGFAFGMRSCNSYTCGGVTCNYHAVSEGAGQFDSSVTQGFKNSLKALAEEKDENGVVGAGGHALPFHSPNTTSIGCGTYIANHVPGYENNANIYCQYSERPVCSDLECCKVHYWTEKNRECEAAIAKGNTYYRRAQDYCESYPNADHKLLNGTYVPYVPKATSTHVSASTLATEESVNTSSESPTSSKPTYPASIGFGIKVEDVNTSIQESYSKKPCMSTETLVDSKTEDTIPDSYKTVFVTSLATASTATASETDIDHVFITAGSTSINKYSYFISLVIVSFIL